MSLSSRLGILAGAGVLSSGLAHAGWLWFSWTGTDAVPALGAPWWPLAAQASWTLALAAAVAWQIRHSLRPLQRDLGLLRGQADALEQGRFVVVQAPALPELAPLARSLNGAVRRVQTVLEQAPGAHAQALSRLARRDAQTDLDSRHTFLRRLTERLADRAVPDVALLALRLRVPTGSGDAVGAAIGGGDAKAASGVASASAAADAAAQARTAEGRRNQGGSVLAGLIALGGRRDPAASAAAGAGAAVAMDTADSVDPADVANPMSAYEVTAVADVAELLRSFPQRVPGAFVGRLAAGDFALCLPAHGLIAETACSLMQAVQSHPGASRCVIAGVDHLAGASLGGALALLDLALTQAEAGGPGQIECRSAQQEAAAAEDGALRRQIVEALRAGELQLGAYPVVDGQGRLLHLESPMRLRLQSGGPWVPALGWLAVATRYRLVTQIDLAGVERALAACARDGQPRCVHVAAESLATAGFVSAVRAPLEAAPAAAARLSIEISEVSLERLPPRLRNAGTVWRRCGARVGIEHAGAALRSLARLSQLEFDYVKVDADFVRGLARDPGQRERAQGLVAFVHELGAQVIAEGVDDASDLATLWQLGFDGATGAAVSRAHAAAAVGVVGVVVKEDPARDQAMSPT